MDSTRGAGDSVRSESVQSGLVGWLEGRRRSGLHLVFGASVTLGVTVLLQGLVYAGWFSGAPAVGLVFGVGAQWVLLTLATWEAVAVRGVLPSLRGAALYYAAAMLAFGGLYATVFQLDHTAFAFDRPAVRLAATADPSLFYFHAVSVQTLVGFGSMVSDSSAARAVTMVHIFVAILFDVGIVSQALNKIKILKGEALKQLEAEAEEARKRRERRGRALSSSHLDLTLRKLRSHTGLLHSDQSAHEDAAPPSSSASVALSVRSGSVAGRRDRALSVGKGGGGGGGGGGGASGLGLGFGLSPAVSGRMLEEEDGMLLSTEAERDFESSLREWREEEVPCGECCARIERDCSHSSHGFRSHSLGSRCCVWSCRGLRRFPSTARSLMLLLVVSIELANAFTLYGVKGDEVLTDSAAATGDGRISSSFLAISLLSQALVLLLIAAGNVRFLRSKLHLSEVSLWVLTQSFVSSLLLFAGIYLTLCFVGAGPEAFSLSCENGCNDDDTKLEKVAISRLPGTGKDTLPPHRGLQSIPFWQAVTELVAFSATTLSSTGYGRIFPVQWYARLAVALEMLASEFFVVVILGLGSSALQFMTDVKHVKRRRGIAFLKAKETEKKKARKEQQKKG